MSKTNVFALFGILFLSSVLLGNGIYSNQIFVLSQENEAEVEADIEQENKCKKDTECENENELNNQLSITNITQRQSEPLATLNVIKTVLCSTEDRVPFEKCLDLGPEDAQITVTGNNPNPSEFPGSSKGTLVTLGAGDYTVDENFVVSSSPYSASIIKAFSGDCAFTLESGAAIGTIAAGESQTCSIVNVVTFFDD